MLVAEKEFSKIIKHPMLWTLTFLFILLNMLVLYDDVGDAQAREHFHRLHDVILDYGINLENPNPKDSAIGLDLEYIKFYLEYVKSHRTLYDNLDMHSIFQQKQELQNYHPTGAYGKFLKKNYEKLQKRLEEIKSTGEGNYGFYPGSAGGIHSLLYGKVTRLLMLETSVLMMLSILYLMDYERLHRTRDLVLATRVGKKVMRLKILTGTAAGFLFSTFLSAASFAMFFYCVPFRGLWNVPVSSVMMAEPRIYGFYPFITFWRLTEKSYFALTLLVLTLLLIVTALLTAALQLLLQNSYFTFLLKVILYMVLFLIVPGGFTSFADVLICLNPSALWISAAGWFMEHELILSFAGNEFWCIGLWTIIALIGLWFGRKHYLRLEIK